MASTNREGETTEPASSRAEILRVFLNYRREETSGHAGRLFDDLAERLEGVEVFMDIDRIAPGVDFTEVIDEALDSCDVVLALIGRRWSALTDDGGRRRLEAEDDFVRLELEKALGRSDVRVIPVLVHGANMPPSGELPDGLRSLARRQAFELSDTRWHYDLNVLVHALEKVSRIKVEQAGAASAERERLERERLERERLDVEREAAEQARVEADRLAAQRVEAEQRETERLKAERLEAERIEAARLEAARLEREREEQERVAREREEAERAERERLRREAAAREQAERELKRRAKAEQRQAQKAKREHATTGRLQRVRGDIGRRRALVLAAASVLAVGGVAFLASQVIGGGGESPPPASPPPRAAADTVSLSGANRYVISAAKLIANDRGQGLRIVGLRGGKDVHGSVKLAGNATRLVYTPDAGYDCPVRFTYTVRDSDGDLGVATVTGRVKGLGSGQKDLVALVPSASRDSCVAGRSPAEIRCGVPVGELVVRRYATTKAAETALATRFRGAEGTCDSAAATGQWNWPGASSRRGRFGCSRSGGRPTFGWTYPSPARSGAFATVTGRRGTALKQLSAWFFERARLPKPS